MVDLKPLPLIGDEDLHALRRQADIAIAPVPVPAHGLLALLRQIEWLKAANRVLVNAAHDADVLALPSRFESTDDF